MYNVKSPLVSCSLTQTILDISQIPIAKVLAVELSKTTKFNITESLYWDYIHNGEKKN